MTGVLHGEVLSALTDWLPPNDAAERPQVQLATVDEECRPDLRTVLLSEWDERGFVFHTDTGSRKAVHLRARPDAALLVLWPGFTRQLTVRGRSSAVDADAASTAFRRRSAYLQQLAWQNTAALAQLPRSERTAAWLRFSTERVDDPPAPPSTWGGFVLRPDRVTFWESDAEGPSHRTEHRHGADGSWTVHHLPG